MGEFITVKVHLETKECGSCGILFAAPKAFWAARREDGKGWYCPSGCVRVFTDTVQKRLEEQERDVAWLKKRITRLEEERNHLERSRNGYKGKMRQLLSRAAEPSTDGDE